MVTSKERADVVRRAVVVMNLATMIALLWYYFKHVKPRIGKRKRGYTYSLYRNSVTRKEYLERLLLNDVNCKNVLRMRTDSFRKFVEMLRDHGGLTGDTGILYSSIEEKVATFLAVIGHHSKQRIAQMAFMRSGETVSRSFHEVLAAVLKLYPLLLSKPTPVPDSCVEEPWCHFKGCLGAIDGTYVPVTVPARIEAHYRNRKGVLAVNVLGVCDSDMKFIYVLTGWEGSVGDGRVLRDALSRPDGLTVPRGNYYLVDAAYMNCPGFLPPFDKTRYHLQEWADAPNQPENAKEYFNLKHSSARNVIERTFGLLKKRFAILRSPSFFPLETQNDIILACCLVHNFLRDVASDDLLQEEADIVGDGVALDDGDDGDVIDDDPEPIDSLERNEQWDQYRRNLAHLMFFWSRKRASGRRT